MKQNKLILFVLCLLIGFVLCIGCEDHQGNFSEEHSTNYEALKNYYRVIEIDSCEYIVYSYSKVYQGYGFMSHKGNCKYCEQRRKIPIPK